MGTISALREEDRPEGNYRRLRAGDTLPASAFTSGWPRVVKICPGDDGAASEPAAIELPGARLWAGRDLVIVDTVGAGFTLVPSISDQVFGDVGERARMGDAAVQFRYRRPVLRLIPLLSDLHDEADAWVVM